MKTTTQKIITYQSPMAAGRWIAEIIDQTPLGPQFTTCLGSYPTQAAAEAVAAEMAPDSLTPGTRDLLGMPPWSSGEPDEN